MTAVQEQMRLLAGASPQAVAAHFYENFGVVAEQHFDGRLWLFDYDQLAAHKHRTTDVVMESRGLILCAETLNIVRRPFARFFNIGEAPAYEADIDYARLEALEKADGSLVTLYFNQVSGHWQFGTRGTPFATGKHRLGGRFYERIARAAGLDVLPGTPEFDERMSLLDTSVTYLFEFIGPDNPLVTPYEKNELVLLGARWLDGEEYSPVEVAQLLEVLRSLNWMMRAPRRYPIPLNLKSLSRPAQIEAIKLWVATAAEFKGLHEGVVCLDPVTGKRVKVKTPLYCAAHLQGWERAEADKGVLAISVSRVAELIVAGDADEFCLYFPDLAPSIQKMAGQVEAFIDGLAPIWDEVKDIEDQKAFAVAVQAKAPGAASGIFFQARKSGVSPALAWMDLPFNKKVSLAEKLLK
ncbi:hypothetical protein KTD31_03315 [Burkholderia multivorans]|uniref:RNA ligase n=1 Tax=Burkholderia multivorans TaxID=87883 RepID=UPI001C243082|nr:RNA ligase [Burkholderia multivorans]MBU9200382.1 hypothetical protein [Burkholderia multivorans]MDN8078493.1 RNA ligase [Burkholderia multivorans]